MPSTKPLQVRCPNCGAAVPWTAQSKWRPFCSERCRLIDLGEWLNEEKRIPGESDIPHGTENDTDPADHE